MKEVYIKARAKINLNLEILDKREDNYHNIKSVFQKINLYDEMYLEKSNFNKFELQTNIESLNNEQNIVYNTYVKLKDNYKNITGVKVILNKKIPMEAGLAGGSTDCASFILGMKKLFDLNMSKEKIFSIAKELGADVVPCLYNRAVLAEGIGDEITTINTSLKYYIVIVKPGFSCNTKEMYKKMDEINKKCYLDTTDKIISGLENNNLNLIASNLHNMFEDVLQETEIIKKDFLNNGALGSLLSGSGSCVYGIFENKQIAKQAYNKLKEKYQTYICTSSKKE